MPSGFQRLTVESPEDLLPVAVFDGMLFPDEGIGGNRVEGMKVLRPKRPELEKLAFQYGLQIEGHSNMWVGRPGESACPTSVLLG